MAQPFELKFIVDLAEALGQVKSFAEGMGKVTEAVAAVGQVGEAAGTAIDTVATAANASAQAVTVMAESVQTATSAEAAESAELARLTELLGSEETARASLAARIIDTTATTVRSEEEVAASLARREEQMAAATAKQQERIALEAEASQAAVASAQEETAAVEAVHEVEAVALSDATRAVLAKREAADAGRALAVQIEDLAQAQRNLADVQREEPENLARIAQAQQEVAVEARNVAEAERLASETKIAAAAAAQKLTAEDEKAAAAAKVLAAETKAGSFRSQTQELGNLVGVLGLVSPQFFGAAYGLQMLAQAAETFGPKIEAAGGGVAGFAVALGPIVAVGAVVVGTLAAIAGAAELVGAALKAGVGEQESETSFAILLGNVEKAKARLEELDATALKFHLNPGEVRTASEELTRLSQGALGAGDSLHMVIELSARSGKSLSETGAIIGRMYEVIQSGQPIGRMAQQLLRMGALSASDVNHLNNLHKEGAKGPEVWAAAEAALNKYGGAAEARANTFEGAVKGIKSGWDEMLTALGRPIADALTPLLQKLSQFLADMVPKAKEAGREIKEAVDTIYGLVENGNFGERLENTIRIAVDNAALHMIAKFKEAWAEIRDFIAKTPLEMAKAIGNELVTPGERSAVVQAVGTATGQIVNYNDPPGYKDPLDGGAGGSQAPAAYKSDEQAMQDEVTRLGYRNADLDRHARERGASSTTPNAGTEFKPTTPGNVTEPDAKGGQVGGRTKEVDAGAEAEKHYQMLLDVTKGKLGAGEISQEQASAENIKTTQDYIAKLLALQSQMSPTSEKYSEMSVRINAARASLLKLGEGEEAYQAALALTKSKLDAGIITQAQAEAENNRTITAQIAQLRQLQTTVNQTSAAYQKLETEINKLTAQKQQTTALGQITATFRKVINEWGDLGKNASAWLSTSMNSGISSVSQGLTGLITKTGSWKQTFTSAIDAMLSGLIELGVKTVLHYAIMGAMMLAHAATGHSTTASVTATQVTAGATIAAAHAPAAAATSVSSYGVAAIVGAVLAIAAIGAIIALLSGGFAEGGLIPGGPSHADNRIARVATGEYIVRTAAVQHYGVGLLEMINGMGFPLQMPAYADGGLVGGMGAALMLGSMNSRDRGARATNVNVGAARVTLIQPNTRSAMHDAMRGAEGDVIILDAIKRQRHKLPFGKGQR